VAAGHNFGARSSYGAGTSYAAGMSSAGVAHDDVPHLGLDLDVVMSPPLTRMISRNQDFYEVPLLK
jgi:hypothetical protein